MKKILLVALLLSGCATGYNPQNAGPRAQDRGHPTMRCPAGTALFCEVEGGALVGKTYTDCRCRR